MTPETPQHPSSHFGSTYPLAAGKARTTIDDGVRTLARLVAAGADPAERILHALDLEQPGRFGEWLRQEVARVQERDALAHTLSAVGTERVQALAGRVRSVFTWSPLEPSRGWLRRRLVLALDVTPATSASDIVSRLASAEVAVDADDPVVAALLSERERGA